jgi:hypothetical protein
MRRGAALNRREQTAEEAEQQEQRRGGEQQQALDSRNGGPFVCGVWVQGRGRVVRREQSLGPN